MAECLTPGFYRYTLLVDGEPRSGDVLVIDPDATAESVREIFARLYFPGRTVSADGFELEPFTP